MINERALQRRKERSDRVAAVKALGIKRGDWVVSRGRVIRAYDTILDTRKAEFRFLRRATEEEIASMKRRRRDRSGYLRSAKPSRTARTSATPTTFSPIR